MASRAPISSRWSRIATAWLPFADAASDDLPLGRLLRLSLFQVSVGMTTYAMPVTTRTMATVRVHSGWWRPLPAISTIRAPTWAGPIRAP